MNELYFDFTKMFEHKLFVLFQDIMNRDKEDELPAMQVKFIDTICLPIYEVSYSSYLQLKVEILNYTSVMQINDFAILQCSIILTSVNE